MGRGTSGSSLGSSVVEVSGSGRGSGSGGGTVVGPWDGPLGGSYVAEGGPSSYSWNRGGLWVGGPLDLLLS